MRYLLALLTCLALPAAAQDFTTLKGHGGPIMDIAVAPDGSVVTASFDNSVGVWSGREPTWLEGHSAAVVTLTLGSQGIVSGGDDFSVILWRGETSHKLGSHKGKVSALATAPGGLWVTSGSWDGTIRMWPLGGGIDYALNDPGAGVTDLAFDQGGQVFASTNAGRILRYETPQSDPVPLVKHGFGVNKLIATQDWLAYGAVDGGTRIIDPMTGAQIADFTLDRRPILSMAYHAATNQLAVGDGQGYIMMIDTAEWRIRRDFRATRNGPVWALAFANDGQTIWAGGLDDVAYGWPVASLDKYDPAISGERSFLQAADTIPNGERQFVRKCSICHALDSGPSRKAGPTLHGVFGRRAGTVSGYRYSQILDGSEIIWDETTIDALFDQGPDHYIPGSKMPMQVITRAQDRADLITFLKDNTQETNP